MPSRPPFDMTPQGLEWRQKAIQAGCTVYYAPEPTSSYAIWGYAPDEDAFRAAKTEHPDWLLLNDAKAYTPEYPLVLHHCDCWRLRQATTRSWPKVISETRESLERWARENRPNNPIVTCGTCVK